MSSTYVVELTPPGRGAVAVVLVTGPDALAFIEPLFNRTSGRPLREASLGRIVVGRWGGVDGEELVVCRRSDDEIEIHCHGGFAAVAAIVESLVTSGAVAMPWREWLRLCAAHIALADATTERTALILLDQ